jgi:alpha-L-rhamnosidase
MKTVKFFLIVLLICFSKEADAQSISIKNLQVNFMHNPVGLDSNPQFSWEIAASRQNVIQTSYKIRVYDNTGIIWDSGDVKSSESNNIRYSGKSLKASLTYSWEVKISTNIAGKVKSTEKALFETGLLNSGWGGAQWIMYDNTDAVFENGKQTGKTVMFRSEFNLDKTIKSAKIYTTSLGIHDLYINGKRVGHQTNNKRVVYDELKPGWTDVVHRAFYLTYDVRNFLTKGQNAIGAYVGSGWASGGIAHDRYKNPFLSYKAKLIVEYTDGTVKTIVTNTTDWKSSTDGALRMADIYNGEDYDARYTTNWMKPDFKDTNWHPVTENNYFKGELTAHLGHPVRVREDLKTVAKEVVVYDGIKRDNTDFGAINSIKNYTNTTSFSLKKGQTAVLDFGQNLVGWTPINIKGQKDTKIRIRYAEMLNDSGKKERGNDGAKGSLYLKNLRKARASVNYIMNGNPKGESYKPSMTWFGFRYAEITADADIEIKDIYAEVISSVEKESSSILTDNKNVNKLFQNTLWGERGNFISVPMDCPQRNERMGWTADTQVFAKTALYNSNVVSFYQKWMGDLRNGQDKDGAFPTIAPQTWGAVGKGEAAWADAGIIVPWMVYTMTGNKTILEENYAAMSSYMNFLAGRSDDKYLYNGGGIKYGDWLAYQETDKRYISVVYYAYDAILMASMAKALDKTADVEKYNQLFQNIKAEFNKRYVIEKGTLNQDTQTAYLYALKLNLFNSTEETQIAISKLLKLLEKNNYKLSTGFLGTAILNQTLSEVGESDMAYNLLLQRDNPSWIYSIDQGATTIWERWNSYTIKNGFGDASMNSFNHYSYGAVVEWMYAFMAGIRSEDAGFRNIIIEPQPDFRKTLPKEQKHITEVTAQYASINGLIKSHWKIVDKNVEYKISIPANTNAKFIVPITMKGLPKVGNGVKLVSKKLDKIIVELGSGEYSFNLTRGN